MKKWIWLGWIAGASWASVAFADVPPPDRCDVEGARCDNAGLGGSGGGGSQLGLPGICQRDQCQRGGPDGPVVYDCLTCIASEAGAAGSGMAGSGMAGSGTDDSCDCRVGLSPERSIAGGLLLVGLLALGGSRRRRRA